MKTDSTSVSMTPIEALQYRTATNPGGIAFIAGRDTWTYRRLATQAERLSRGLAARGVRSGDRVALHMPNLPELVVSYYACLHIGVIAVPLNIRLKTTELTDLLRRIRPALYIGDADLYSRVCAIEWSILPPEGRFIVGWKKEVVSAQPWTKLLDDTFPTAVDESDLDAPALLLATSGTTGVPKLVTHTKATLAAVTDLWRQFELHEGHTAVIALPMVHAAGLLTFFSCVRLGVPMVLLERFDADAVLDVIELHRCSWLAGLPFMFAAILEAQRIRAREVGSLRFCMCSGDVVPLRLQQKFRLVFGAPLRSTWAASEAPGSLTYGCEDGPVSRVTSRTEARLVDDTGAPPPDQVGELAVRGANVSIGYWIGPDTIEGFKDGWFYSGDLMRQNERDDLWFVARKKDLIIRGGSNISPMEVERVMAAHPGVKDVAVVGIPDDVFGQRVVGFLQLESDSPSQVVNEVLEMASSQLADYKVPEHLQLVASIPRNNLGKVDRKALLTTVYRPMPQPSG